MVDACTSDDLAATIAATTDGSTHPATTAPAPKPALPGVVIGRYVVLSQLGAGAMGVVYAAYDPELDRKIGLKVLLPGNDRATYAKRKLWPNSRTPTSSRSTTSGRPTTGRCSWRWSSSPDKP